jgi:osmotically-inducible protein OsmY
MSTRKNLAVVAAVTAPVAGAAGAAIEWLFDPETGKARRRQLLDQTAAAVRRQTRGRARRLSMRAKYERGRLRGALVRAGGGGIPTPTDDVDVKQQIHQALRAAGIPMRAVSVEVSDRVAVLRGQVDSHVDIDRIGAVTGAAPGVHEVESYLHLPGEAAPNKREALRATPARS